MPPTAWNNTMPTQDAGRSELEEEKKMERKNTKRYEKRWGNPTELSPALTLNSETTIS